MSRSLLQMIKDLEKRVSDLENKPATVVVTAAPLKEGVGQGEASSRAMCPKCGVKPNHFFHVKNCTGQKEQKDDDQRRDTGPT